MKRTLAVGVLLAVGFTVGVAAVYVTLERMLHGLKF